MSDVRKNLSRKVARFTRWATSLSDRDSEWQCGCRGWPALDAAVERVVTTLEPAALSGDEIERLVYGLARGNECGQIAELLRDHPAWRLESGNGCRGRSARNDS